jgi:hypothetical protein
MASQEGKKRVADALARKAAEEAKSPSMTPSQVQAQEQRRFEQISKVTGVLFALMMPGETISVDIFNRPKIMTPEDIQNQNVPVGNIVLTRPAAGYRIGTAVDLRAMFSSAAPEEPDEAPEDEAGQEDEKGADEEPKSNLIHIARS